MAVTLKAEFDAIKGDSLALYTLHPDKFEIVPRQNETEVVLPCGLTEPFNWAARDVTLLSSERVTEGRANVVKLKMLPEVVPTALVATALK